MSVISTNHNNAVPSWQHLVQVEGGSVFILRDFVHGLLSDLNRRDGKSRGLLRDKTNKTQPVRVIILTERDTKNPDEIALAIRKIHSLLKKNLGFLINFQDKTIDSGIYSEFVNLLEKCKGFADQQKFLGVCQDLQKLRNKIDKIVELIEDKKDFFLYRYKDGNRATLAFRLSYKTPEQIQKYPEFWRWCTKVACVKFSQMRGENKGVIPKELLSEELTRRIFFPLVKVALEEKGNLSPLQSGLRFKESVWRFICLRSMSFSTGAEETISDVTQGEFLQILDFLLSPKKHPLSWTTLNSLWDIAQKLGVEKVKRECLLWLKSEMAQYTERSQDERKIIFNQAVSWYQDLKKIYPLECEFFFSEVVQSTKRQFLEVLDCLIEKVIEVTRLTLSSASELSTADYKKLSALGTLRKLSLGDIAINDEAIKALASLKLSELDLNDARRITEDGFQYLARMTTLKRASIGHLSSYLSDTGLKFLSCMPLSRLDLRGCFLLTNDGLRALKGSITELSFGGSPYLTPAVLANLASLPLEKLTLSRIPGLATEYLLILNSFSNLKSLKIVAVKRQGGLELVKITETLIPLLGTACPQLTHLRLDNIGFTNTGMQYFHAIASLEELILSQVSVSSIGSVTRLSRLTHLGLLQCHLINERSLRPLIDMPSLRSLELMSQQIGDASFPDILNITQLTNLNLAGCFFSNPQALKDSLSAATRLKRLYVSTQFFSIAQGIAPGILAHSDVPAAESALENLDLDDKQLWEVALSIKDRIPLDYFKVLILKDDQQWTHKVLNELEKRKDKKHNLYAEDFEKALQLMSRFIYNQSFGPAISLWDFFFKPDIDAYKQSREDMEGPLVERLFNSIYEKSNRQSYDESKPCPLSIINFLLKKQRTTKSTCRDLVGSLLTECKGLFDVVTVKEIEDLDILCVQLKTLAATGVTYLSVRLDLCRRLSHILGRLVVMKVSNFDTKNLLNNLCGLLLKVYDAFLASSLKDLECIVREIVDLIVFAQKYELEELEKFLSINFVKYLSSSQCLMTEEQIKMIVEILQRANLSILNLYSDMPTFWLNVLESQESLKIVRR